MADCAVMGVDWRTLTWWEYQALLFQWNVRHSVADPKALPAPADAARMRQILDAHSVQ